jgi:lysophospholipase L1-like esterase
MTVDSTASAPQSPTTPALPPRRLGRKLLLLAGSIAVGFFLVEIGLRLVGMGTDRVWEPHPRFGWHHVPGATTHFTEEGDGWVRINSLGYRDRERTQTKPPGSYRIAVFGDSMTEGMQVNLDQTFCQVLEERLSQRGRPCEVLNLGISGYGPLQELLLAREELPRLKPDCVVLALFLDNDIADSHPNLRATGPGDAPYAALQEGQLVFDRSRCEAAYVSYHKEPLFSIRKYSSLYRLLSKVRGQAQARAVAQAQEAGPGGTGTLKRYQLYQQPQGQEWQQAWAVVERALLDFAAEARRQQAEFVVASVPAGQVVSHEAWERILAKRPGMAQQKATFDLLAPEQRLKQFASRHGIRLLSATPAFRQAAPEPQLFFGNVGHFTARGHALMAECLERFLSEQRLPPAS